MVVGGLRRHLFRVPPQALFLLPVLCGSARSLGCSSYLRKRKQKSTITLHPSAPGAWAIVPAETRGSGRLLVARPRHISCLYTLSRTFTLMSSHARPAGLSLETACTRRGLAPRLCARPSVVETPSGSTAMPRARLFLPYVATSLQSASSRAASEGALTQV